MSFLSRHFSLKKPNSFTDFSFRFTSFNDHQEEGTMFDDWEFLEVLEQELGVTSDGDDGDVPMSDPVDVEESPYSFVRFGSHHKIKYRILSKADVRKRLEDKVRKLSTVLSLSRNDVLILLHNYKWSVQRTQEEWLTHEETVRNAVGLLEKPVKQITDTTAEISCRVCEEWFKADTMHSVSCGHRICRECWTDYISAAISNGRECLALKCPALLCEAAVGLEMVELVASQEDKKTFDDYLLKSSVSNSRKAKWCPAPGCELAAFLSVASDGCSDIDCQCLHSFCWNCSREAHSPVDCSKALEWMSENMVQSNYWLLANARPCPGCGRLIETDSCTRYSRCISCNHLFDDDETESEDEGIFKPKPVWAWEDEDMDIFKPKPKPSRNYEDRVRVYAKNSLKSFQQYYDGWSNCEAARANAVTDLKVLKEIQLEMISDLLNLSKEEFGFLFEAQEQVVHCWRLLKWTYVYGYFLPEEENNKRALFEFMHDQALRLVSKHAKLITQLLNAILNGDLSSTSSQYMDFRGRLPQLTSVTRSYLERFVEALKSGQSEVKSIPKGSPMPNNGERASYSRPSASPSNGEEARWWSNPRPNNGEGPSWRSSRILIKDEFARPRSSARPKIGGGDSWKFDPRPNTGVGASWRSSPMPSNGEGASWRFSPRPDVSCSRSSPTSSPTHKVPKVAAEGGTGSPASPKDQAGVRTTSLPSSQSEATATVDRLLSGTTFVDIS